MRGIGYLCKIAWFSGLPASKVCMILLLKHIQSLSKAVSEGNIESWYWEVGGIED